MPGLETLDWIVIVAYGAVVLAIGAWANRRQRTTEDYFLGGRRMRWWAVGISLIATSFSSVALIGCTGWGFSRGMDWLQLQAGDLLGIAIAVTVFLPFFARLGLTTAYEYLGARFGTTARALASGLFVAQTLMRAGILVLAPALALSTVVGIDLAWAIVASGLAALVYSASGGITAVVWTDLIQLAVVVLGVAYSLALVAGDVTGGFGAILEQADAARKLEIVNPDLGLGQPFTPVWTIIAYGTLALSLAGTGQQAVQRYLSCRDVRSARKAAYLGWAIGLVSVALTLFLGVSLAAWSGMSPDGGVLRGAGDDALPLFIVHCLPAGIAGLLVAAIFAASMSSMDSAIHSMSTATLVDFVRRFRRKALGAADELRYARVLTVVFGLAAINVALLGAVEGKQLLDQLIGWLGYFAGPLLGLFVLGMFTRRTTEVGAVAGTALAGGGVIAAVLLDAPKAYHFHRLWLAPAALVATIALGYGIALLTRGTSRPDPPDRPPASPAPR